jgi:hypothetical protein
MELTEFLLARIAEDGETARGAFQDHRQSRTSAPVTVDDGVWRTGDHASDECRIEGVDMIIYDEGGHTVEQAIHIARHDPARVLTESEAKRRIVDVHAPDHLEPDICATCASHAEGYPCRTLLFLALPYADHPDYDESWRS